MTTPVASPQPAAEPGQWQTIGDTLLAPATAMERLARRPQFALVLALLTLVSAGLTFIAVRQGVMEQTIRRKMESSSRFQQLPARQRDQVIDQTLAWTRYTQWLGAVAGPAVIVLLVSGVCLLMTHLAAGGRVRFRQMFAVAAHAWLPNSLQYLIAIPILLAKDPAAVDFENLVPMANLGWVFSREEAPKLYRVASSLDLFSLWALALLALGMGRLTGKGAGASFGMVLVPWILYVLVAKVLLG